MFWSKTKIKYKNPSKEDPEIKKYLNISSDLQREGYRGLSGYIQDLGHKWIANNTRKSPILELGCGLGRHYLLYAKNYKDYYASEISTEYFDSQEWLMLRGRGVQCNAIELPYHNSTFRTVISIYNLEHIAELKSIFSEVKRILKPGGTFLIAIPCEDGVLYNLTRELTTKRRFQKIFGINYDKVIAYEHKWNYRGIIREIEKSKIFQINKTHFLPFVIPSHHFNLIACLECFVIN